MIEAIGWSALATATLLIGMVLAYRNLVNLKWTGLIMGFGAGAIISAAAYQLVLGAVVDERLHFGLVGLGIAAGALTFYFADKWVDHLGGAQRKDFDGGQAGGSGTGILLGSLLDGVPESLVLGLSIAHSPQVSLAFVFAVAISNIPQGLGGTAGMLNMALKEQPCLLAPKHRLKNLPRRSPRRRCHSRITARWPIGWRAARRCASAARASPRRNGNRRQSAQTRSSLLIENSRGRIEDLIPIRYGRMLANPFAFYRGAAAIMASDLSHTPSTGLNVQACGDCHLVNFGGFATAERKIIFDINDFDETSIAPWEWDVKRLTASFVMAGRNNGFSAADCQEAAQRAAQSYRSKLAEYSQQSVLDVWYDALDFDQIIHMLPDKQMRQLLSQEAGRRRRAERAREGICQAGVCGRRNAAHRRSSAAHLSYRRHARC